MAESPQSPSPRRILPTGPLGPPETPPPAPGRFRTHTAHRVGPLGPLDNAPDGFLIPPVELWRGYGSSPAHYIQLATANTQSMLAALGPHASSSDEPLRVLDFGCAACPMLRTLAMLRPNWELWGCDIDPVAIDWARRHLSPALRLFTNTTAPHLPLPDSVFDLIYAGSVFTHIEHLADAWLLELARVLRPGALLYVTIHDRAFIRHTIANAPHWDMTRNIVTHFGPDAADGDWQWRSIGTGIRANIFYARDYFLRMASPAFDLIAAIERAYGDQTALLLRRRI